MTGQDGAPSIMNLEELLGFREITERISSFLHKRLKDHLATLSPLLAPGRVLPDSKALALVKCERAFGLCAIEKYVS